jgi:hypothetical protein
MDEASWKLLLILRSECEHIAFILLIQSDTQGQLKFHSEVNKDFYKENILGSAKIIDLPPLRVEDLNTLISDLAPKYHAMMIEEIT